MKNNYLEVSHIYGIMIYYLLRVKSRMLTHFVAGYRYIIIKTCRFKIGYLLIESHVLFLNFENKMHHYQT